MFAVRRGITAATGVGADRDQASPLQSAARAAAYLLSRASCGGQRVDWVGRRRDLPKNWTGVPQLLHDRADRNRGL
jgi:hypothetical protein